MKTTLTSALLLISVFTVMAHSRLPEYDNYIETYKQFAIDSRDRYGIPAAITMAQGILESGAGTSNLASECNNHFGIKCGSSWYGKTMTKDDDSAAECFRCYSSAQASFDDHSEFLRRQRYAFLFDYPVTDYGSWAHGLRQAGYATDPAYPQKLIALIETYELYLLDGGKSLGLNAQPAATTDTPADQHTVAQTDVKDKTKTTQDQSRKAAAATTAATSTVATVAAPAKDNTKTKENVNATPRTTDSVIVDRAATYEITENNGVKCIRLSSDASFKRISKLTNIPVDRLLYLNDLPAATPLHAGDVVYLSWKKAQADRSLPVYTVKSGDSMHSISQEYGIRLTSLYKLNDMEYGTPARVGQQLKLHR